jgi:hypothetical protein
LNLRQFTSFDWFTICLIVIFLGIVVLKSNNVIKFALFAKLAYSDDYFKLKDKELRFFSAFEMIAIVIAHLIITQFIYFLVKDLKLVSDLNLSSLTQVFFLFLIISFISFLKYQIENLVNKCITDSKILRHYQVYKQIIWSYSIYLGLPFLIMAAYYPSDNSTFLFLGLAITVAYYILKILIIIYKNRRLLIGNWYYFILYLCALEIAPYFFLYKIIGV